MRGRTGCSVKWRLSRVPSQCASLMEADQQPALGSALDVPGKARGPWHGWVWGAPAVVTLTVLGLMVAWQGGGIASTARWPEHQAAFLVLNAALAALPAALWSGITLLGDSTVLMPLLALFLLRRPQVWAAVLASVPVAALFSALVKHWAGVPRPAAVLDQASFNLIGSALHQNSFPSGHSITAFAATAAVLATLASSSRREWLLVVAGLFVATTIALSRVAVGAHWPLDLIAGASGGWLAGLSGAALARPTGWWRWFFLGAGKQVASAGLILWGLLLWFRPHDTLACATVLGLAGLSGIGAGIGLLLKGQPVRAWAAPLAAGSSAPDALVGRDFQSAPEALSQRA